MAWNLVFLGLGLLAVGIPVGATASSPGWQAVAYAFILAGVASLLGAVAVWRRGRETPGDSVAEEDAERERLGLDPSIGNEAEADTSPDLTFGRGHLPREPQFGAIEGFPVRRPGRLIQIPVINAQGAGEAVAVHAELNFMPDDRDGSFSPREPAQGEWVTDGAPATRINLPGNGQAHLLNLAVVFSDGYPCIYEWTKRSRDAQLNGYGMWSNGVDVEVVVRAAGPSALSLRDTLKIEVLDGLIHANWQGAPRSNWVGIEGRRWPERDYL